MRRATRLQMTRALSLADVAPRRGALLAPLLVGVLLAGLPPTALGAPPAGPDATTPGAARRRRGAPGRAPRRDSSGRRLTSRHDACRPGVFPGYPRPRPGDPGS